MEENEKRVCCKEYDQQQKKSIYIYILRRKIFACWWCDDGNDEFIDRVATDETTQYYSRMKEIAKIAKI